MLIFSEMSYKPKAEVERVKNGICLTDDELIAYEMLIYDRASYQQVADELYKSTRTITRMAKRIGDKIISYYAS